ncbi:hypothetical protein HGRIS_011596 [Hohenbuehelia grisea]|uniref:Integral membrane protein n=1 Tax=Hohenbuehelia grisea TaxID=104357 RepID=A0ABR3JXC1_9AGAR
MEAKCPQAERKAAQPGLYCGSCFPFLPQTMLAGEKTLAICMIVASWTQGAFTILFTGALFLIWRTDRPSLDDKRRRIGIGLVIAMYTVSTINFGMEVTQSIIFAGRHAESEGIARRFATFAMIQITFGGINCTIADLLLIWRAWVICGRSNRVIILPAICFAGVAVCSCGYYITAFTTIDSITGNNLRTTYTWLRSPPRRIWAILVLTFTCATNLSMTGVISYKLIKHQRLMRQTFGYSKAWIESLVIIEPGAVYSIACVVYLILVVTDQEATIILMMLVTQRAGIVPTLIIVTISAGMSAVDLRTHHLPSFDISTTRSCSTHPTGSLTQDPEECTSNVDACTPYVIPDAEESKRLSLESAAGFERGMKLN